MPSTASPQGVFPVSHPSGEIRQFTQVDGIASAYATGLWTGTPIKRTTDGTWVACGTGVEVIGAIFMGCEFTDTSGRRLILPNWPAAQTYTAGSMILKYQPIDNQGIYQGQTAATVAASVQGEAINLQNTSQGNILGQSTQALGAPTGATNGMFRIIGLAPYPDNNWDDAYVNLYLMVSNPQGPVA